MKEPLQKIPAFFKTFIPVNSSHRLEIPLAFTVHMKGMLLHEAFLRDRCGNLWPVEVTKFGNDLFFQDGWVQFLEDNCVEEGDFLVFQYNGNDIFDFNLLGRTQCEKEGIGAFRFNVKEEEEEEKNQNEIEVWEKEKEEEVVEVEEEEEENEEEEEDDEDDNDDDDDDEEYMEEEEEGDDDDDDDDSEGEEEEEEQEVNKFKKKILKRKAESSGLGLTKFGRSGNYGQKGDVAVEAEGEHKRANANEIDNDSGGGDVFESGLVVRPKNPYFVTKIRRTRRNELYVPFEVIKDHNLKLPHKAKIMIHDQEGKRWKGIVAIWKDGRTWLSHGWKAFCKWNNVRKEDRVICEFLHGKGRRGTFLQARILRAGSWLPQK